MKGKQHILLWILVALLGFCPVLAFAQEDDPILALTADRISYATGYATLTATGHVEIVYGDTRLRATQLEFDQRNDMLRIEGPLYLMQGEDVTILAEFAELSSDLQNGILASARMVLSEQLQISAVEINRSEGRYTQLFKAAASTCTIGSVHTTPLWQVRAARIIHDQEQKRLFFQNAQLRVGKVPIAYIPRLRVPDPSVLRATGFLVPEFSSNSVLGSGFKIPYFIALGDHKDITLTPYVTDKTGTLEFRYRQAFHNGDLSFEGAITGDNLTSDAVRGYLFGEGSRKLKSGAVASFQLRSTTDQNYLNRYGFSTADRLESYLNLENVNRQSYFLADLTTIQSVRSTDSNNTLPYLLSEVNYRKNWSPRLIGGQAKFFVQGTSLNRKSSTDGDDGRDVVRGSISADWSRGWQLGNGVLFNTIGQVNGDYYFVSDDSTYPAPFGRFAPVAAVELRWPWAKTGAKATHMFEPIAQLVWSPDSVTAAPNDDSVQIELESTNLFSLNRYSGRDSFEAGLRANVGLSYSRISDTGWNFNVSAGRVFRAANLGQFSSASGLAGVTSDIVSSVDVLLPNRFKLGVRTVFDDNLQVSKNETSLIYKTKRLMLETTYVWLGSDLLASSTTDRSEWAFDATYDLRRNWSANAAWRYDFVAGSPSSADATLTYSNECIKLDFSLSQQFASSTTVSPSTSVGLKVSLNGFGSRANSDAYNRECSAF